MLLALDIGNTNVTAGVFDGETLVAQWRLSTLERTADELAAFFAVAFQTRGLEISQIRGVAISSVVPKLTPAAVLWSREGLKCEALVIGADTETGLVNEYSNPAEVGADRLVNGLAAWKKFGGAVVIADFGTATTVDAVSSQGQYLGGAIAPGLQISTDALFRAAARLPRVELKAPEQTLARSTPASVQAGIVYGYAGLVKELTSRCAAELRESGETKITIIATGGLAELIAPHVPQIQHVEPQLTLAGLRLIWDSSQLHPSYQTTESQRWVKE